MYTLIVFEEADQELQEAAVWYEEKSIGLGLRLIDVVKRKLEIVRQNPEKNARKKGNFRQSVIKTFPYVIVYTFYKKEGIITVSSIFHTSRNPKKKYRKYRQ